MPNNFMSIFSQIKNEYIYGAIFTFFLRWTQLHLIPAIIYWICPGAGPHDPYPFHFFKRIVTHLVGRGDEGYRRR